MLQSYEGREHFLLANAYELFGELKGDATHFQKTLRDSDAQLKNFDKQVEASNRRREQFAQRSALQQQRIEAQTAQVRERLNQQAAQFAQKMELSRQQMAQQSGAALQRINQQTVAAKMRLDQQAAQFQIRTDQTAQKMAQSAELAKQRIAAQTTAARERLAQQASQFESRQATQAANKFEAEQRRMQAAAERASKGAQDAWSKLGSGISNLGQKLTLAITAPLVAAGVGILRAGVDYEKALNIFQSVTKATGAEMQRAAEIARKLGADVSLPATSAKDAALAMSELGKAGLTAAQSMDAAKGVLQLAAAGQIEEARAAEIAANALNSFKLQASDTARVADLLAAASNASSAEVSDIAQSMQQASAVAAGAKIPIEDLTAAIGLMANAGIKGSDAGTSLKTFIQRLQSPTDNAAGAMKALGISVFDAQGRMREMPNIIGQFEKALSGLTDEKKAQALNTIFGADALRAAQILFSEGSAGFEKMKGAITQVGAAADLAKAKTLGVGGSWEAMKSQLETIGIDIFNAIKAPLTSALQYVGQFVEKMSTGFSGLSPVMQQVVIGIGAFAAALPPVLIVVGSVISAVTSLASGIAALGGLGTVAPVIAGIGVALAAVGAAAYAAYTAFQENFGGIRDFVTEVSKRVTQEWQNFMDFLGSADVTSALDGIKQGFQDLSTALQPAFQKIDADFKAAFGEIITWWDTNGQEIKTAALTVFNNLKEGLKVVFSAISTLWQTHGEDIKQAASAIWNNVTAIIGGALRHIGNFIKLAAQVINGNWAGAWETLKDIVANAFSGVIKVLSSSAQTMISVFKAGLTALWNLQGWIYGKAIELGKATVDGFVAGIRANLPSVSSVANALANAATGGLKNALDSHSPSKVFMQIGKDTVQGFIDGINALKSSAQSALANLLDISSLKGLAKGDAAGVQLLTGLINELAKLNITTKEQEVLLELTAGKYAKLNAQVKERILNAARSIDADKATKDAAEELAAGLDQLNSAINKISKATVLEKLNETLSKPSVTKAIEERAKALGLQAIEFANLLRVQAQFKDLEDIKLPSQTVERTETGTSISDLIQPEVFEEPPRLKAAWEDFFATFNARVEGIKASLPSLNQTLGESFTGSLERIGDVFGNAVAQWDGTLSGFFSSVAKGFQQMATEIVAQLIRIAVMQAVLKLISAFAGGAGGDSASGIGAAGGIGGHISGGAAPGFAQGGFTGAGRLNEIAGLVHKQEFVMPADAVKHWGLGVMNSLKNLQMPQMSPAMAGGYGAMPTSTVNNKYSNPVTVNMTVVTPNANTFKQSQKQIESQMLERIQKRQLKKG